MDPTRQRTAKVDSDLMRFRPVSKYVDNRSEHAGILMLREHDIPR